MPLSLLAPIAAGAGLLEAAAFAPLSWWPTAIVAVAVLTLLVGQVQRLRAAIVVGLVYGLAFNLATLVWQSMVLVASYLGLAAIQAAFFAALGGLLFAVRTLRWAPVAAAACWVLVEAVQARFPFGGFGWTALGYTTIDTPLAGLLPLGGVPLASFAVALVGQVLARAIAVRTRQSALVAAVTTVGVFGAGALGWAIPGAPPDAEKVDVGWVQGGASGEGFYGLGNPGDPGRNQSAQTRALMQKVAAGELPQPAFIVWPENGTDADPLRNPATNKVVADAVAAAGVPILLAVPTAGQKQDERYTSYLYWTNAGPTARYDKRNLVPFGEWIPFRDVLLPAIPVLEVIGQQTMPGTEPGALSVTTGQGQPITIGVAICYEVAFAPTMADAVNAGAEVMVVGSNNAMFQGSAQIEQQFAITRARAASMRREILVVTTSGISGLIDDHGRVVFTGPNHVGASGVVSLSRTTEKSPFLRGGWLVEYLLAAAALVALGVAAREQRRSRQQWASDNGPRTVKES